jgi:integrase
MARKRDNKQGGLFIEYKIVDGKSVPKSENWVGQYYDANGKRIRKSTGTPVKAEAEGILRGWMADSEKGFKPAPQTQGLTYDMLRDDLLAWAEDQQLRSLKTRSDGTRYFFPQTALDTFFAKRKVNDIDRDTLSAFIRDRRAAKMSNATINNSLALLRKMFNLARDNGKLTMIPKFDLLPVKARQGFLPQENFQKLFDAMPSRLQPLLLLLYHTGIRIGEAEKIQWDAVNLDAATITLLEGETKNSDARVLPLTPELVTLLSGVENRSGRVFPSAGVMENQWAAACKAAGITPGLKSGGLVIHAMRRTAVRHMMQAGAQQAEAMKISGHKSATVFQRYNIIDTTQTADVMRRVSRLAPVKLPAARKALPAGSRKLKAATR